MCLNNLALLVSNVIKSGIIFVITFEMKNSSQARIKILFIVNYRIAETVIES